MNFNEHHVQEIIQKSKEKSKKYSKYGVILTKDEQEELDKRIEMQDTYIPKIKNYINHNITDTNFAGIYIDQAKGGEIYIGFKELDKLDRSKREEIKRIFPDLSKIKFYDAKYTESELNELHTKLNNDRESLQQKGVNIVRINTDIKEQKLQIFIDELNEDSIEVLKRNYDSNMFSIHEGKPIKADTHDFWDNPRRQYIRPLVGGLSIETPLPNNYIGICTIGFLAAGNVGDNNVYAVTAGHCSNTGADWYQGQYYFGTTTQSNTGGSYDGQKIKLNNPNFLSFWIYGYGTPTWQAIYNVQSVSEGNVGDTACISAGNSHTNSCGTITHTSVSAQFTDGSYITNLTAATYVAVGGDSGGTVHRGGTLLGIHTGGDNPELFSHISYVTRGLKVIPLTRN